MCIGMTVSGNMSAELASATNFLVHLIRLSRKGLSESQLEKFRSNLSEVLRRRYRDHWFPEKPFRGSGYRCIRINGKLDPVLAVAAEDSSIPLKVLRSVFPSELTLWIDPREVSYRIGENGSISVLYEYKTSPSEPWKPSNVEVIDKPRPCAKESLRNIDYLLDPRRSALSVEQLTAYVAG